jgi:Holliday junction resolvasome RuvABC endonuclease subunit
MTQPHILVSIDPGSSAAGIAIFEDAVLVQAVLVKCTKKRLEERLAWLAVKAAAVAKVNKFADDVVFEMPKVYPRSPVDPNTLIVLALAGGVIAQPFLHPDAAVHLPNPQTWKEQTPKDKQNDRTVKELGKSELAALDGCLDNNVLDAVGLGIWWLKTRGKRK